jgi:hypothetical protein
MYYIRKYVNGWAIHDDDTGKSRLLTEEEKKAVAEEFPSLKEAQVRSIFSDNITSIRHWNSEVGKVVRKIIKKHRPKL